MRWHVCSCIGMVGWAISPLIGAEPGIPASDKPSPSILAASPQAEDQSVNILVDQYIATSLREQRLRPSARSSDMEYIRRVYLDIVGHIPPLEELESFLKNKDRNKRSTIVNQLMETDGYIHYWSDIWTNLLVGRDPPRAASREHLTAWVSDSLSTGQSYDQFVYDLVSATGEREENGAVNFLLSHLNDQATPATAKISQLFLGMRLQCTQCHDHPFNQWKQDQFWQLNAFFRQTRQTREGDDETLKVKLLNSDDPSPVYFERRSGLMSVAFPTLFDGTLIEDFSDTNRRRALALFLIKPENRWLSEALVNRMWGHFFGYGFTHPMDDMGPHNPPTHPEVLRQLAVDFVQSNFDVKHLIRTITSTEAYHRSSVIYRGNERDDPASGSAPSFSRMYVKQMTAEQLYRSLIIATQADQAGAKNNKDADARRDRWLKQFVVTFGTDENDETTTFDGTIPQALMMMNGDLMQKAVGVDPGSLLVQILQENTSDAEKIRRLYLVALCRYPSLQELNGLKRVVSTTNSPRLIAFQDLFWALLNSNEFMLNH
ncbi:MAG: DUF1549 and DUF1553 domain-containing protein [Planctomycetes bacterium]|nr:DUF1549 and DUF1553 domain-containing protein [Planctomycetota bacterium]